MSIVISVIVPVFNVEKYLEKCILSILAQTYKNFELILVDDASPDSCPEICDRYANIDQRIRVLHCKKNGGLSAARNIGIEAARGKWITFVDSDDWVSQEMLQYLYEGVKKNDAQIAVCDFFRVYENGESTGESFGNFEGGIFTYEDVVRKFAGDENIWYTIMFGKLFDSTLFKEIRFPQGKLNEDVFVTLKLFKQCRRVCSISRKLYYYVSRNTSIMHKYNVQSLDGVEAVYGIFKEFYRENRMELLPGVEKLLFARLTTVYKGLSKEDRKQTRVKEMIGCSKETAAILKRGGQMPFRSKVRTELFYRAPGVFFLVENFYSNRKRIDK